MKNFLLAINYVALIFLLGLSFIVLSAFLVDMVLGFFVLGAFLAGVAIIYAREVKQ